MTLPTERLFNIHSCLKCGTCCITHPCALAPSDLARIASFLHTTAQDLFRRYLVLDYVLAYGKKRYYVCPARKNEKAAKIVDWNWTFSGSPCIFLHENKCTIEPVKPRGGRTFVCRLMTFEKTNRVAYGKRTAAKDWGRNEMLKHFLSMAETGGSSKPSEGVKEPTMLGGGNCEGDCSAYPIRQN